MSTLFYHFLPIYLARSSLRSLASFCRCSELIESVQKKTILSFQVNLKPTITDFLSTWGQSNKTQH